MTDARREYLRAYREKHGDPTAAERARRYRAKRPARTGEFSREWANLDQIARRKRARVGPVIEKQGGRCSVCGGVIRVEWIPGPEHYARPRREVEKASEAGSMVPEARVRHVGLLYDPEAGAEFRREFVGEILVAREERSPLAKKPRAPKRNRWALMTPDARERRLRAIDRLSVGGSHEFRALSWHVPAPLSDGTIAHRGCQSARSSRARYAARVNAAAPRFSAIEEAWTRQGGACARCARPMGDGEYVETSRPRAPSDPPAPEWAGGGRPPVVTLWHRLCRP